MLHSEKTIAANQTTQWQGTTGECRRTPAITLAFLLACGLIAGGIEARAQPPEAPPAAATGAPDAAPPTASKGDTAVSQPSASDWPCVQRKVETLTAAQMWDGPPLEEVKNWRDDKQIAELVPYVISRRIEMDAVEGAIEKYAKSLPEDQRDEKLTQLFAGVLHETNVVRSTVVQGIETFQRRQRARAERLEQQGRNLAALQDRARKVEELADDVAKLQNEYDWNARVFAERQESIPVACEIPVDIEQRAFAVARAIRNQMSE